ncbi:esterase family protein [Nocardia yunnanensis]|uniref:Esterase family protein n=1 Tax=Nocardia yunnanensis TaxID=2382165 RepID=A0A386ZJS2_9NOCA|nr:alpha/beta hydrolase family protein [Nocardia yunnanensis]AYF77668.1 esterase family protein [Nocardia yunnanensis]
MKLSASRKRTALRTAAVALSAALSVALAAGTAAADPDKPSSVTSVQKDGRTWHLQVYSAAMGKDIPVDVQRPADESQAAPNLYMLNGLDGGLGTASWNAQTNALGFLSDKQVNVIQPIGGRGSYYTDWINDDPQLGRNKWTTFFTQELPPLLDAALGSTGLNALAGLSTSGTSVLQLAEAKPGLWKSVAAYSGCAQIADPMGKQFLKLAVETWAGGKTVNMYGPDDSPLWAANDPVINAEKLRGTNLYISSGSGIPLMKDVEYYTKAAPGPQGDLNLALGMLIEGGVDACTHNLESKLDSIDIPATYQFDPVGTHYWPYWENALHNSWPMLAAGMGISA